MKLMKILFFILIGSYSNFFACADDKEVLSVHQPHTPSTCVGSEHSILKASSSWINRVYGPALIPGSPVASTSPITHDRLISINKELWDAGLAKTPTQRRPSICWVDEVQPKRLPVDLEENFYEDHHKRQLFYGSMPRKSLIETYFGCFYKSNAVHPE